jgi:hypothetical protein
MTNETNANAAQGLHALQNLVPRMHDVANTLANAIGGLKTDFGSERTFIPTVPVGGFVFGPVHGTEITLTPYENDTVGGSCGSELASVELVTGKYKIKIKNTGTDCPVSATIGGVIIGPIEPGVSKSVIVSVTLDKDTLSMKCGSVPSDKPDKCSFAYDIKSL